MSSSAKKPYLWDGSESGQGFEGGGSDSGHREGRKVGNVEGRILGNTQGRILGKGGSDSGHPSYLQQWIFNRSSIFNRKNLQQRVYNTADAAGCDLSCFDWGRVMQDATKFKAIPCRKRADRHFLYKAITLTQATIPPFALWDVLAHRRRPGRRAAGRRLVRRRRGPSRVRAGRQR